MVTVQQFNLLTFQRSTCYPFFWHVFCLASVDTKEQAMQETRALFLPPTTEQPNLAEGSIFFIGTATVILRYAGFTVLTDPNFLHQHDVAHLGYGLRSKRRTNPAIELQDLPPVDFVLLSHFHEDHFDRLVIRNLDKTLPIVTTEHASRALQRRGFQSTHAIDTWEGITIAKGANRLRITSMPGRHGPGVVGNLLPPVMGSMLEFHTANDRTLLRLYITGDTLIYKDIKDIPRRFPNIDLAVLHLGGTRALGVLVTMDAKQGVEMVRIINPTIAVPIHYNDYTVFKSPLEDFQREVKAAGLEERIRYLHHGETYTFGVPESRRRA
jgi:L-ascorbate metabolism protein UlaG (beta-lactamase superfamily)